MNSIRPENAAQDDGAQLRVGIWIAALALALRLAWVVVLTLRRGSALEYPDEQLHWEIASRLIHEGVFATADGRLVARMPLYPAMLAPLAALGDWGVPAARVLQALLGAATAWIGWRWAREALGGRAAVVAGLLIAIEPYSIFFSALLLSETPYTFVGLWLAYAAWRVAARPEQATLRDGVMVGLLGAAAIMTRPSAAGLVVLTWLLLAAFDPKRQRGLLRAGMCALLLASVMLPWGLRNREVVGSFAWLSANGGVTLYDGQGPQARGDSDQSFLRDMPELTALGEVERDERLRKLAIEQMMRDPARVLELAWEKLRRTWSLTPNVAAYSSGATAWASAIFSGGVLALAAVGLLRSIGRRGETECGTSEGHRSRRLLLTSLWMPVIYYTLLHCLYVGSLRYRLPVMPMVEIAAAAAFASRSAAARAD